MGDSISILVTSKKPHTGGYRRRGRRCFAPFGLLVLLVAACGDGRQRWTTEVITLTCGESTLRFEERAERVGFAGASFYEQVLLEDGVEIDFFPKPTPVYSRLHRPGDGFRVFAGATARPGEPEAWDVFADVPEYEALAACLERNREAIDAGFNRPRREEKHMETYKLSRLPRLTSIVRRRYHSAGLCGEADGAFHCPEDRAYLRLVPPDRVELCLSAPGNPIEALGDVVGLISADGRTVTWRAPHGKAKLALAPPDWKHYYRTCRDTSGRSPVDLFPE